MSDMGEDDLLREATRALRDTAEPAGDEARFTRSRVLASLRESRVQRRTRVAFLVPLLAAALAATAGATESGRAFFRTAMEYVGLTAPREEPVVAVSKPRRLAVTEVAPPPALDTSRAVPATSPPAPPGDQAPETGAPSEAAPSRETHPTVAATSPLGKPAERTAATEQVAPDPTGAARPAPSAAFDPAHALYLQAHALHFTEQDPGRALGAWSAYLAAAPGGRFALEARYNRALCLVRLGRRDEARAALEPFASGTSGGYRQQEARKLLDALNGSTGR